MVGTLAILGLTFGLIHYLLPTLGEQASHRAQGLMQDAVKAQAALQARSRQSAPPAEDVQKVEPQKKALEERRADAESLARQEAQAREAVRKEAAWQAYFKRSATCAIEANHTNVDCVNEYIRARRDFDHRWESGQL